MPIQQQILIHSKFLRETEASLKGCIDPDAAERALYRDPQTLSQAVQYTQIAVHGHKLLNRQSRLRISHVSFGDQTLNHDRPNVQQVQIRQT